MSLAVRPALDTTAAELFASQGILKSPTFVPASLKLFVSQADRALGQCRELVKRGELSEQRGGEFPELLVDACRQIMLHPIIASNNYLKRFSQGVTFAQAKHELQQFSIFAAQFNAAQALLVANAPTLEAYEERLHLLLNEEGIPYEEGFEGELTGRWSMETVHFTWLRSMAEGLGLKFEEIGKIWLALPGTRAFVDATFKYYTSTDQNTALGASFGIENWAANSLWEPWIAGMRKLNATLTRPVDMGYLTYHDAEEKHHSQATLDELLENFREPWFDSARFLKGGRAILDEGVLAYYESQLQTLPEKDGTWPARVAG
jgi:pyrroloquinoline quinone (PQQ) biosynthesis protein C